MGARSSYAPGTFCWVDLSTSHAAAAAAFYGALFGWQTEDVPAGESVTYNAMLHLDGAPVAALYGLTDEQQAQGVRPHWLSYVSVEDVDASAQRAARHATGRARATTDRVSGEEGRNDRCSCGGAITRHGGAAGQTVTRWARQRAPL